MNNSSANKNEEGLQKKSTRFFWFFFLEIFSYKKIITDIGENRTHY